MPRTGLSSQELAEKALELAVAAIRQHGVEKFRLSDIARELGVSHAALYNHLPDKAALLDVISERWLTRIDSELESVTRRKLPVRELIGVWFQTFHQLKLKKVQGDPELFKSFNMAADLLKPFVLRHLGNVRGQLLGLVRRLAESEGLTVSEEQAVEQLFTATISFHHPRLVLEHKDEERTELLILLVDTMLAGLCRPS